MAIASIFSNSFFKRLMSFGGDDWLQTIGSFFSASFFRPNSLLRRIRSFDSSDEQNQTMAGSNHPSAPDVENQIPGAMEMEMAGSPIAGAMKMEMAGSPIANADPEQDSKLVLSVTLTVTSLCSGIYASIPASLQQDPSSHPYYYVFLLAFIVLGVVTSIGLFIYSLLRPTGAEVAWIRKRLVVVAIVFSLVAFVLRISFNLSVASWCHVCLLCFVVTAVIALCLYIAWKKNNRNQSARAPVLPI